MALTLKPLFLLLSLVLFVYKLQYADPNGHKLYDSAPRGKHSLGYVEIKCQLDATEVFIADLIACSTCFGHHYAHHQELKSITQWLLPVVFRAVVFQVAVLVWS